MTVTQDKIHKVYLEKEKETLLITLYAKALDSRLKNSVLNDKKANELVNMIDYDFEKLNSFGNGNIMVIRAKQFDVWLKKFLKTYPDAIVLNIGCGLDTRISRINPQANVQWFDVDYPEVIKVRKLFYSNTDNYEMIESSIVDFDWLKNIPREKPTMIIAEGVLEYLKEDQVKTLFNRLIDHFPHGQIAFDVMNSFAIKSGKESLKEITGAEHTWAVDHVNDVDKLSPRFTRVHNHSILGSKYTYKLSLKYRFIYASMFIIPSFRNMMRLLLYKF